MRFESVDIGSMVDFRRQQHVPAPMPGEEMDLVPPDGSAQELIRGPAVGGLDFDPLWMLNGFQVVNAAAADHADFHSVSLFSRSDNIGGLE
jgi:hypothetical protein